MFRLGRLIRASLVVLLAMGPHPQGVTAPEADVQEVLSAWLSVLRWSTERGGLSNHSRLCLDPKVIDASCGDGGRGTLRNAELAALAEQGDAMALHFHAQRQSRKDPQAALEFYRRALVRGSVTSLGGMAELHTQFARDAEEPLRTTYAEAAYVHRIAGMMLGFIQNWSSLVGEHVEYFPDLPISASMCAGAAQLVAQLNDERAALELPPLTVYFDHDAIIDMTAEDGGHCQ